MYYSEHPLRTEDTENGLLYEIGTCTIEYCVFILSMWIEKERQIGKNIVSVPLKMRRVQMGRFFWDEEKISWQDALIYIVGVYSIRVISTGDKIWTISDACVKKISYSFEFMYKMGEALVEYNDLNDIFTAKKMEIRMKECNDFNPPHRIYINDVIDYYRLALSASDPYIKFISFYHVVEYFYDEVFKQRIVEDLRIRITHPDFSYKNSDKLYDVAKFIKNRMKMIDELGNGNELESLCYVLQEFVDISELKIKLMDEDKNSVKYYQNKKVSFCKAPVIQWNDSEGIYKNIAKRVYYVRNALVHSKSGKNDERYKPYKDEKTLLKEIPLIKAIAEMTIISSSNIV